MIFVILSEIFVFCFPPICIDLCVQSPRPPLYHCQKPLRMRHGLLCPWKKTVPVPSVILCDKIEENWRKADISFSCLKWSWVYLRLEISASGWAIWKKKNLFSKYSQCSSAQGRLTFIFCFNLGTMKYANLDTTLSMVGLAEALVTLLKWYGKTVSSWALAREKQPRMACSASTLLAVMKSRGIWWASSRIKY